MNKFIKGAVASVFALFLTGCFEENKEIQPMENTLIKRSILFGNPDRTAVRLSQDAKYLSFIAPKDGVLNMFLAEGKDFKSAKPITNDTGRGIRTYFWAYNNENIVYSQDTKGDENFILYSINIKDNSVKAITPEKVRAMVVAGSRYFPDEILVGINDRNPEYHDIYRINLKTGESKLIFKNDEYIDFTTDDRLNIRFIHKMTPDGSSQAFKFSQDGKHSHFYAVPYEDVHTTAIISLDKAGTTMYMVDSRDGDTAALISIDADGKKRVIAQNDKADISDAMFHPVEKTLEGYSYEYERNINVYVDDTIKADFEYLQSIDGGEVNVASRSGDDTIWIVAFAKDNAPISYYWYDRVAKKAEFLFYHNQKLSEVKLSPMLPVVIKSRDGLSLVSYLTLPLSSMQDATSIKPKSAIPLVIDVHGGPTVRDSWGYDPAAQWLANRGYAVLKVNYRGSTGFGKRFIRAGDREWAGKMHDDIIDAMNWAVEQGITTKDKVAIYGGSYGGYASLVGLTFTPDAFACAVDIVGPSNLVTLINSIPPYWKPAYAALVNKIGGDPKTEEGKKFLESRSPLTFYNKIKKPLLIAQGANDPRVKQAESDQIVNHMVKDKIPVTYLLYSDEGHGFARPENRMSFYAVTEQFLKEHLGGQSEAIGEDFKGSSIEIYMVRNT